MQRLTELRKRKTILKGGYPLKTILVGQTRLQRGDGAGGGSEVNGNEKAVEARPVMQGGSLRNWSILLVKARVYFFKKRGIHKVH